jgi:hypothetical protein
VASVNRVRTTRSTHLANTGAPQTMQTLTVCSAAQRKKHVCLLARQEQAGIITAVHCRELRAHCVAGQERGQREARHDAITGRRRVICGRRIIALPAARKLCRIERMQLEHRQACANAQAPNTSHSAHHRCSNRREGGRPDGGSVYKKEDGGEAEPGSGRPGEKALISARATTTSASQQASEAAHMHFILT